FKSVGWRMPDSPTMAMYSPAATSSETSLRTVRPPKRWVTASSLSTSGELPQLEALHLAGRRARQLLHDVDALRTLEARQGLRCLVHDFLRERIPRRMAGAQQHV